MNKRVEVQKRKSRKSRRSKKNLLNNFKRINLLVMIFAITIIFSFPTASEGEVINTTKSDSPEKIQSSEENQALETSNEKANIEKNSGDKESYKPIAYLTVDDGPTKGTHQLLDLLAEYDIKATFFMLEPNMKKYSDTLTRMEEEGHALGMHGVSHNKKIIYRSKESVVNEMSQGRDYIKKKTTTDPYLIRVPYGSHPHMSASYKQAVKEAGFQMWDWNVDSNDWRYKNNVFVDKTIGQIQNLQKKNIDPVILIHDLPTTVNNLRPLLKYLSEGFEMRTLSNIQEAVVFGTSSASNIAKIIIPTFDITINDVIINNQESKYPFVIHKNVTYLPLTWNYTQALGIKISPGDANKIDFSKAQTNSSKLNKDLGVNNVLGKSYSAQLARQKISVNGKKINNNMEEYPFLMYRDIIYLPLTWKNATEEFDLKINWSKEEGLKLNK